METVPQEEICRRLSAFKARLSARGLSGALVTAKTDRFYLSGTAQEGFLWIGAEADPVSWILRDPERARAETPLDVVAVDSWRELWNRARRAVEGGRAGITADTFTVSDLLRLGIQRADAVEDVSGDVLELRGRKSPWEIAKMEEAGEVAATVFAHAAEILRPGMTEAELAGLLFARAMTLGHEGLLRSRGSLEPYSWHVLSGPNAALPGAVDTPMSGRGFSPSFPTGASHREIRRGEPVLVDFVVCVFGYQTDQARTFCVGPPPRWLSEAHASIEAVRGRLTEALRPGARAGDVFAIGVEKAGDLGLQGYLGPPGRACRFVGHGVGLETVEPPIVAQGSNRTLEEGMTLALEPKAVLAEEGGAGVEDTFLITDREARPLAPLPPGLIVV